MSTTEGPDLEAVPGFAPVSPDDPAPADPPAPNPPASEDPGTTSTPTTPPPPPSPSTKPESSPSSTTSTEAGEPVDVEGAVGQLGEGAAYLLGAGMNKAVKSRTGKNTRAWLMSEREAAAIGAPLARIALRRVPDEMTVGDAGDGLALAAGLIGYGLRNVFGMSPEQMAALEAQGPAPSPPAPAVTPPPPAPTPTPPPPVIATAPPGPPAGQLEGVAPAEPPPPSAIPIDI